MLWLMPNQIRRYQPWIKLLSKSVRNVGERSLDSLYYWQHKLREQDAEAIKDQPGQDVPPVPVVSSHKNVPANPPFVDVTQQTADQINSSEESLQAVRQSFIPELVLREGKFQLLIGSTTTKKTFSMVLKAIADA